MEQSIKKTGTTTVGVTYNGGVVIASEQKATMGSLVDAKGARKVYKVNGRIGITTAGGVGDIQAIVRLLRAELKLYELERKKPISVKSGAMLLSNILQGNKFYPYMGQFIIGGFDDAGSQVFSLDPLGGLENSEAYYATGSGMPYALGVLEDKFKENMTEEEALRTTLRAIRSAVQRDTGSGGKGYNVAIIDSDGYRELSQEEIKKHV